MDHEDWLRSHVERCLEDGLDICRAMQDPDGDYPFREKTAAYFVSIDGSGDIGKVKVWSPVVRGVKSNAKLLKELNDVNKRITLGRMYHGCGDVMLEQVMPPSAVTTESLALTCHCIANVAADVGPMIAAVYGGSTFFDSDEDEDVADGRATG